MCCALKESRGHYITASAEIAQGQQKLPTAQLFTAPHSEAQLRSQTCRPTLNTRELFPDQMECISQSEIMKQRKRRF